MVIQDSNKPTSLFSQRTRLNSSSSKNTWTLRKWWNRSQPSTTVVHHRLLFNLVKRCSCPNKRNLWGTWIIWRHRATNQLTPRTSRARPLANDNLPRVQNVWHLRKISNLKQVKSVLRTQSARNYKCDSSNKSQDVLNLQKCLQNS